jgi:16S rRNA (guanine(966)-N(2))-methyltransferase RsmD
MRVIAGSCKGRVLFSPRGKLIRPTSDRIKEFIFDYLGPKIENASILDLFSGTGNLSIEALSRGADLAILVDKSKEAIRLIYRNLELTKLLSQCQVIHQDVFRFLKIAATNNSRFDCIFADPPYSANIYSDLIDAIGKGDYLKDEGLFILECDSRRFIEYQDASLLLVTKKIFGDSAIFVFKKEGS